MGSSVGTVWAHHVISRRVLRFSLLSNFVLTETDDIQYE